LKSSLVKKVVIVLTSSMLSIAYYLILSTKFFDVILCFRRENA
ncbi:hypothetical protein LCGC14_2182600, partial [marine sediment metagenome]